MDMLTAITRNGQERILGPEVDEVQEHIENQLRTLEHTLAMVPEDKKQYILSRIARLRSE